MTAREWHKERAAMWTVRRDAHAARGLVLSRLRLATFLGGVALAWWGVSHSSAAAVVLGGTLIAAFAALVVWHARVIDAVERADAARETNLQALARMDRDWTSLVDVAPPPALDFNAHPYARDLDLFGHASLTKWLGPAATESGTMRLVSWLLAPADPEVVRARQVAVRELAPEVEWRETLSTEGHLARIKPSELDAFLSWLDGGQPSSPAWLRVLVVALTASIWILIALQILDIIPSGLWLIPVVPGIVLSFACARRTYNVFDRVSLGERALRRYAAMLAHATGESWSSPELQGLQQLLRAGGEAPAAVRQIARLAEWSELRTSAALLHFPIQAITLWDFHILFAIERWRTRCGHHTRGWFEALAQIDALSVFASIAHHEPDWALPLVDRSYDAIRATALAHPLIPADRRVANDVEVGPPGTVLLITGSNMSGKSTLLRAIGLNIVLAEAGAPVCATAFSTPPAALYTSIRVQDSLELGLSYFMAALARLKTIVDAAERHDDRARVLVYLLDEVLQGTNSVERAIAVRAVARHLLDAGAIGAMTTHDLSLAEEEPLRSAARLVHFTEHVEPDGRMSFDYRLRPGLATSRNALRLMQLIGIQPK
jgi:ABC-type multidrug transport system fused ATPase/permease subunit